MAVFVLSFGLRNLTTVPLTALRTGGSGFMVAYILITCLVWLPLVYLQGLLGQYWSTGSLTLWRALPIFAGVGTGGFTVSVLLSLPSGGVIGHSLYYLVLSCWPVSRAFPIVSAFRNVAHK